jgi:NAD(P)-dependent dehydrogenase (short-subunit alcohol dehydrogenase family)
MNDDAPRLRDRRPTRPPAWTPARIPRQDGKTALVTGANSGIGFCTALELARAGAHIVLACRDAAGAAEARHRLDTELPGAQVDAQVLDLADLRSIRNAAVHLRETHDRIDILVNNAGVMGPPTRLTTVDGFELQFGTNHLGHFALTGLLLPALLHAPAARVVTVTSMAHAKGQIRFDDLHAAHGYDPYGAYAQSKLANILFALELDRLARSLHVPLISVAVHPGLSPTGLQSAGPGLGHTPLPTRVKLSLFRLIGQPPARAAWPSLYAATAPDVTGGSYYGPGGPGGVRGAPTRQNPSTRARDATIAHRLWQASEEISGVRYHELEPTGAVTSGPAG